MEVDRQFTSALPSRRGYNLDLTRVHLLSVQWVVVITDLLDLAAKVTTEANLPFVDPRESITFVSVLYSGGITDATHNIQPTIKPVRLCVGGI